MFFDQKPSRSAWIVVDENGAITGSVPGSMELLAPFPGLPAHIVEWSREWSIWATAPPPQAHEVAQYVERCELLLEAAPIVPLANGNTHHDQHGSLRVLIRVSLPEEPSMRLASFGDRFGFTKAECRVAMEAAEGLTPADIALRLRLSVQTVRSHLKRMFQKTGVHSQGGLVKKLLDGHHASRSGHESGSRTPDPEL